MSSASRTGRNKPARRRAVSGSPRREKDAVRRQKKAGKRVEKARRTQQRRSRIQQYQQNSPFFRGLMEERQKKMDAPLLLITFMLLGIGLIALMSSSYPKAYYSSDISPFYYFIRQLGMAAVGLVIMWIASCYDYHKYRGWAKWLYLVSLIMLILVLTPLGTSINQAQRWLFGFQPSEIAKLAIILLFATVASGRPKSVHSIKSLLMYAALIGVFILLLAMEPHMSAAMILVVIGFMILFVAGMRVWFLIPVGIAGVIIAIAAYFTMDHVQTRLNAFLDPFSYASDKGWQAVQSLIAIGSGGAFGLGLGESRQKFLYLPEPFNDFIFSVVCEELGFIGAALILVLFAYFVFRGFYVALRAKDRFGSLIAVGITMQFAFQILLNLAVVSGLFPVTGASLPLFSYGGTALVMQLLEIGILLNISRNIPPSRKD
ncbi:MAG: putative peptidoglycan glycosyltransferase FtsW [Eubacteriales bacterium]|nr:putative peptidoglycan glycosyltransferase FtsW [Eubacteriales bacterium]